MKKIMFILLAVAGLGSASVQAMTAAEAEDECKAQAVDDGVSADEMQVYIQECVDNLVNSEKSE
jgi:hypothetical protein